MKRLFRVRFAFLVEDLSGSVNLRARLSVTGCYIYQRACVQGAKMLTRNTKKEPVKIRLLASQQLLLSNLLVLVSSKFV
jgi:hypothetical protein